MSTACRCILDNPRLQRAETAYHNSDLWGVGVVTVEMGKGQRQKSEQHSTLCRMSRQHWSTEKDSCCCKLWFKYWPYYERGTIGNLQCERD